MAVHSIPNQPGYTPRFNERPIRYDALLYERYDLFRQRIEADRTHVLKYYASG